MISFAQPSDSKQVASLMFDAMQEIVYKLIGCENKNKAIDFLEKLFKEKNNQYSYHNTLIFKEQKQILGSLIFYDGAELVRLRKPVLKLASQLSGTEIFIENETQSGEFYIDNLSVLPSRQGQGIGTQLIEFLKMYLTDKQPNRIGLLVDENNVSAQKLYKKLGFKFENYQNLAGGNYKHLIYENI